MAEGWAGETAQGLLQLRNSMAMATGDYLALKTEKNQ